MTREDLEQIAAMVERTLVKHGVIPSSAIQCTSIRPKIWPQENYPDMQCLLQSGHPNGEDMHMNGNHRWPVKP